MRVSGIAREYSTLLFPALDIALNYSLISHFTVLSLVIACYRSSPLVIALAVRLAISCYRSLPLAIYLYRLSSFFTACHRLSSIFFALSFVTA
jgi:hypothetical protein